MKCTTCGKEYEKCATVTLMGKEFYYCSIPCAIKSDHSDPIIEAMIQFFKGAKNTFEKLVEESRKEKLEKEISEAFEEWAGKNTSEGSVKIAFRAGFLAGRESK